jgi:hypothetical protein
MKAAPVANKAKRNPTTNALTVNAGGMVPNPEMIDVVRWIERVIT